MKKIGFIGYGLRSSTMMKAFENLDSDIRVEAVCDPRSSIIRETVAENPYFKNTRYFEDPDQMLEDCSLDGVFVGTRCSLHTEMAVKVLNAGLPLFLEKPVAITQEQYQALREASRGKTHRAVVSFPLRLSDICMEAKHVVDSGDLGEITQVQAINNVPYGSVYYHSWYRDEAETGGLFLQKATHDIDYINFLLGQKPKEICAVKSKLYFKGDKPKGLLCKDCGEYYSCIESPYTVRHLLNEDVTGDMCCFARDTGNEDMASAVVIYENDVHASYSQNFIVKKAAARRGARLIGTKGAIEFDWYTGEIRIDRYRTPQTIVHRFDTKGGSHFGGDEKLALAFIDVMDGKPSISDLEAGLISAVTCLSAKVSAETHQFMKIPY